MIVVNHYVKNTIYIKYMANSTTSSTSSTSTTHLVQLNVGGRVNLTTHKSTLLKSSFFKLMFDFTPDTQQPIFIDCDPEGFQHVLEYLRFGNYQIPSKYKYLGQYYGIDDAAFENDNEPHIMIYRGRIVRINKQNDTFITLEEGLDMLTEVANDTSISSTSKSTDVFGLLKKLFKDGKIRKLCIINYEICLLYLFLIIKEEFGNIFIEKDGNRMLKYDICKWRLGTVANNYLYVDTLGIYIKKSVMLFGGILIMMKDLKGKMIKNSSYSYVKNIIELIRKDPTYNDVKDNIVYYKSATSKPTNQVTHDVTKNCNKS